MRFSAFPDKYVISEQQIELSYAGIIAARCCKILPVGLVAIM